MTVDRREQQTPRAGAPRTDTSSEVVSVFDELKRSREHVEVSPGQRALEFAARNATAVGSSLVALLVVLGIGWLLLRTMSPAAPDELPDAPAVEAPATTAENAALPGAAPPAPVPTGGAQAGADPVAPPTARQLDEPADDAPPTPLPTAEQLEQRERRDTAIASAIGALAALIGVLLLVRALVSWLLQRGIGRTAILVAQVLGAVACLGGMLVLALPTLADGDEAEATHGDDATPDGVASTEGPSDSAASDGAAPAGQSNTPAGHDAPPTGGPDDPAGTDADEQRDVRDLLTPPVPRPGRAEPTPFRDMVARLRATGTPAHGSPAQPAAPADRHAGIQPPTTDSPDGSATPRTARIAVPSTPPTPFRDMVAGLSLQRQADARREHSQSPDAASQPADATSDPAPDTAGAPSASASDTPTAAPPAVVADADAAPTDELEPARMLAIAALFGAALALLGSAVPLALSRESTS